MDKDSTKLFLDIEARLIDKQALADIKKIRDSATKGFWGGINRVKGYRDTVRKGIEDAGLGDLMFGSRKPQKTLAAYRKSLSSYEDSLESAKEKREKLLAAPPSAKTHELANTDLSRGTRDADRTQRVKNARSIIKQYNVDVKNAERNVKNLEGIVASLNRRIEKAELNPKAKTGGLFSNRFNPGGWLKDKFSWASAENSIFDKKTIAGNGIFKAAGYAGLRALELGVRGVGEAFKSSLGPIRAFKKLLNGTIGNRIKKNAGLITAILRKVKTLSIKQIAGYIIQLAKEGLKNLDKYSKNLGTPFHQNVLKLKSSLLYLKNAFAALVGPIVNYVRPALETLMDTLAETANKIGAFFAAITGQDQFSAALKKMVDDSDDARKKMLDILGFDEINRLSGDNGDDDDVNKMFTEWDPTEGFFGKLKSLLKDTSWFDLGQMFAEKVNGIIDGFDAEAFSKKIFGKINNALEAVGGFITRFDFKNLGKKISGFFNGAFSSVNWKNIGHILSRGITGVWDTAIAFIKDLNWPEIGKAIGDAVSTLLEDLRAWFSDQDWEEIGNNLTKGLVEMIKEIKPLEVAEQIAKLIGQIIQALGAFIDGIFTAITDMLQEWLDENHPVIAEFFRETRKTLNADDAWGQLAVYGVTINAKTNLDDNTEKFIDNIPTLKGGLNPEINANGTVSEGIEDLIDSPVTSAPKTYFAPSIEPTVAKNDNVFSLIGNKIFSKFGTTFKPYIDTGSRVDPDTGKMLNAKMFKSMATTFKITTATALGNNTQALMKAIGLSMGDVSASLKGSINKLFGIKLFAKGGTVPNKGSLIMVNEAGPEVVANQGHTTGIMNTDQMQAAIASGNSVVVQALYDICESLISTVNNKNTNVYLDGDKVGQSVTRYQNNQRRSFGY